MSIGNTASIHGSSVRDRGCCLVDACLMPQSMVANYEHDRRLNMNKLFHVKSERGEKGVVAIVSKRKWLPSGFQVVAKWLPSC